MVAVDLPNVMQEKRRTDKLMNRVRQILGYWLIAEATYEEDTCEATDLRVLGMGDMRIAVRMRRNDYYHRWPEQFTIRCSTRYGGPSEFDKIMAGWGDYFFYGFETPDADGFVAYKIGRLDIFRQVVSDCLYRDGRPPAIRMNNSAEGDTAFYAFSDNALPDEFWVTRQFKG